MSLSSHKYGDKLSGAGSLALEASETSAPSVFLLYHILGCGFHPQGGLIGEPANRIWVAG